LDVYIVYMNIEQIRKNTLGCDSVIHFNNAGASLVPKQVAAAIRDYITQEETTGGYELAAKKQDEAELFYSYAAQLLHCNRDNIAFTGSATDSYNRALSSIPFKDGDVILLTQNDYPSNFIAFLSLQKRFGIKIILVDNTVTGEIDLIDLERKLQQHNPVVLSVSHIPTSSGLVQPAEAIGNIVKKYDTLYLLDACQSLGQMDVDVTKIGADFVSGTFRKFLRGPRGAGLLYVSDKVLASGLELLLPDFRGAEWTSVDEYKARPNAKRFENWETSFALLLGATEALKYILEIGIQNIEARNRLLSQKLRQELATIKNIQLQDRGIIQCNIITFTLPGHTEDAFIKYFSDNGINIYTSAKSGSLIDFEQKGIEWVARLSPHYYNTEAEIDTFINVLKKLV
jgi:selenocysteine lyase/cysteine desulfurase